MTNIHAKILLTCVLNLPQMSINNEQPFCERKRKSALIELHDMTCWSLNDPGKVVALAHRRKWHCSICSVSFYLYVLVSLGSDCTFMHWKKGVWKCMPLQKDLAMCSVSRWKRWRTLFLTHSFPFNYCCGVNLPSSVVQMYYWNAAAFTSRSQCWRMLQA